MNKPLVILSMLLAPAVASADPHFEILDRGNAVEVIGRDIHTSRTTINVARQRMEIPLAVVVPAKRAMTGDATVNVAEIDPDSKAVSIKLNVEHNGVVALSKYAQAMQIGDDLHVIFPRKLPDAGQTITLPEPTLPVVNKIEDKKPEVAKTEEPKNPEPKPEVAKTDDAPKAETKPEPKNPEPKKAVGSNGLPPKEEPKPGLGTADDSSGNPMMTYIGAGLLALAAGVWLWKKKKGAATTQAAVPSQIDIIAQRSLGGRARVVWLGAGERELMVAVTPNNVSVLGQWTRGNSAHDSGPSVDKKLLPKAKESQQIPMPRATTSSVARQPATDSPSVSIPRTTTQSRAQTSSGEMTASSSSISPALSGLLRLRERALPPVSEEVATDDPQADAAWARELLAATNARH